MSTLAMTTKIRSSHRERPALVYVRQSSLAQVRDHTASTARQYDLVERARSLGWADAQIQVIDQDQGLSGASADGREGFQFVVAQVGLGRVGGVFCLEASRLARSCSDWYRLLEICALTDTLVIDEESVYDPGQYNDRLLLGFKGTMSEAELYWLRQRLIGGQQEKARQGSLRLPLPTGFVYDPAGRVVLDPDEAVQEAVRLVFDRFEQLGSAWAVARFFAQQQLQFPTRLKERTRSGELIWQPLSAPRLFTILHNPTYAGAYVYGRERGKARPRTAGAAGWGVGATLHREPIVIRDAHPSYITWEQYQHNQQRLDDNRPAPDFQRRGAVREGTALLQGMALCGSCGRRMTVWYDRDRDTPGYHCPLLPHRPVACPSLTGSAVDAAVAQVLLEAMQPAQLEVSLAALDQIEARERQVEQQWERRRERARYEAELARRRFVAVDPENRLVARSLERDWEEKLAEVARLEQAQSLRPPLSAGRLTGAERQQILDLARDFPAVWHASTTSYSDRKRLLRLLIRDVTLTRREQTVHLGIRWQTGAVTEVEIARPLRAWEKYATDPAVIERVRALAPGRTDEEIAACLNAEGRTSGRGRPFTRHLVAWLRGKGGIAPRQPPVVVETAGGSSQGQWMSVPEAAKQLRCDRTTVLHWCQQGRLEGIHPTRGRWWVRLTPENLAEFRRPGGEGQQEANASRET